jgi:hypothetical protein
MEKQFLVGSSKAKLSLSLRAACYSRSDLKSRIISIRTICRFSDMKLQKASTIILVGSGNRNWMTRFGEVA